MSRSKYAVNILMKKITNDKYNANLISGSQYIRLQETIKVMEKHDMVWKSALKLKPSEIQEFLNSYINYSQSYIRKIYQILNQVYVHLIFIGKMKYNPMIAVYKPKSKKKTKEIEGLSLQKEKVLIRALEEGKNKEYSIILLLQLFTGMRIGEVLALKCEDIDFNTEIINIDKTINVDVDRKLSVKDSTKTRAGERKIPLPKYVKKMLKEHLKGKSKDEFVFLSKKKKLIASRDVAKYLKKIASEFMDVSNFSTHNLRHTYITRCVESGMNCKVLMKLVGHKDFNTTLGIYTTIYEDFRNSEFDKIEKYYKRNKIRIGEIVCKNSKNELYVRKKEEKKEMKKIILYKMKNNILDYVNFVQKCKIRV